MWCHLCAQKFSNIENFKVHILKVHKKFSEELDGSDSENMPKSLQENCETSEEDIDENGSETVTRHVSSKNKSSISKVIVREKRKKFQKRTLPSCKRFAISFQENSEKSDDSTSDQADNNPVKGNEGQRIENSESVLNNNQVYFINNPFVSQNMNNYVVGNQAVQPPLYSASTPIVINSVVATSSSSESESPFAFNSKNILMWLEKHNELCNDLKYPLPTSLIKQITDINKAVFQRYIRNSPKEEAAAVLNVYRDLSNMIDIHIAEVKKLLLSLKH